MNISKFYKTTKMKRLLQQLFILIIFLSGNGFYAHAQCDNDSTKPSVICNAQLDVILDNTGQVIMTPELVDAGTSDNCTPKEKLSYRIELNEDYTGTIPTTSTLIFPSPGSYSIVLWAIDEAGNADACFSAVTVFGRSEDCETDIEAPVVSCLNGLRFLKDALLFGRDAIDAVSDNCTDIEELSYTIQLAEDFTGVVPDDLFLAFNEPGIFNAYFWVTDLNGNSSYCNANLIVDDVFTLEGTTYMDGNGDCMQNGGEAPIDASVKISIIEDDIRTYSIISESQNGVYNQILPQPKTANASVEVSFVEAGPDDCQTVNTTDLSEVDFSKSLIVDPIGIKLTQDCADLAINVQAAEVSCNEEGLYVIGYYNGGTEIANPTITLKFSNRVKLVRVLHADHAYESTLTTDGESDTYTFEITQLLPGETGRILMLGQQICAYAGQTQIIYAAITSDNACANLYDGPAIQVTKDCVGEAVEFRIENTGKIDMPSSANFVIIEDVIMRSQGTFELGAGESQVFSAPANGATYHFKADQVPDFPWQATTTVALEGCSYNDATISTGKVAQISIDNSAAHIDVAVVENKATVFNRLEALPVGKGADHIIGKNTPIEYTLNYSNTNETGVAKDMLVELEVSEHLDLTSLEVLFATHEAFVITQKENTFQFAFPNIFLLADGINKAAARGTLTFRLQQKANVAENIIIKNEVRIQLDENAPITSSVYHTVGEIAGAVSTNVEDIFGPTIALNVYPNPFSQSATFEIDLADFTTAYLELYNSNGQLMQMNKVNNKSYRLLRNGLKTGLYFYVLKQNGQAVNSGKLFVD